MSFRRVHSNKPCLSRQYRGAGLFVRGMDGLLAANIR